MKFLKPHDYPRLIAFLAGLILPFAFAPFNLAFLAILSATILLFIWMNTSPREAFIRGWWYGFGYFGIGVSWVYVSIHDYGNTPSLIAIALTVVFVAFLGLFQALQGYFLQYFFKDKQTPHWLKALLYFPASWVLIEWIRTWILTGFPWLQLGHSQINAPLAGFIPLVGVFGLTAIVTVISGLFYLCSYKTGWKQKTLLLLAILSIYLLGFLLKPIHWTTPQTHPLPVALVQGNIPQTLKWSPHELEHILRLYPQMSRSIWNTNQLVVWPEAAITWPIPFSLGYLNFLRNTLSHSPTNLVTGIPVQSDNGQNYYNAMVLLGREGADIYYKRYLVPFGEYLPLASCIKTMIGFFALCPLNSIPGSDGSNIVLQNHTHPIDSKHLVIAPFICYEIAFPNAILTTVPHSNLMVVISNDSWFGNSFAPWQHLQIAQFAALAAGRYLLFSTNDGITAVIDEKGQIVAKAPRCCQTVLKSQVILMSGNTPWVRYGHRYGLISLGLVVIMSRMLRSHR